MDLYLDNIDSLSDATIKTYNASYAKLTEMLGQPIEQSSTRNILKRVKDIPNPNTQKSVVVILKKMYPDVQEYQTLFRRLKTQIEVAKDQSLKKLNLPNVEELKSFMKEAYEMGEFKKFIINYLLIHYNVRNKDLDIIVTRTRHMIEDDKNYLYLAPSYVQYIRNDYKTVSTYGAKKFPIKSAKFTRAVEYFLEDESAKFLFNLKDAETHIAASTIGAKVRKYTFQELGESVYFKTIVLDLAKRGKTKELLVLSKRRGTDVQTIIDTYLKE